MHELVDTVAIWVHIASGGVALITGAIAMVAKKGQKLHVGVGRTYVWAMFIVAVSASVLTYTRPNLFLFLIAIFSFYLAFTGWRSTKLKNQPPGWLDWTVTVVMGLCGAAMLAFGLVKFSEMIIRLNPVLLVFGGISTILVIRDLKRFRKPVEPKKMDWFFNHMARMVAAYIATTTAFLVVNVQLEGALWFIPWLTPTIIGSIGITLWTNHYKRKFNKEK